MRTPFLSVILESFHSVLFPEVASLFSALPFSLLALSTDIESIRNDNCRSVMVYADLCKICSVKDMSHSVLDILDIGVYPDFHGGLAYMSELAYDDKYVTKLGALLELHVIYCSCGNRVT